MNGTAATVDKALITVADAYFYRALQRFREGNFDQALVTESGDALKTTVQKLMLEELVFSEMKGLAMDGNPLSDVKKLIRTRRSQKSGETVWRGILRQYGRSEKEAEERLLRSEQADRLIQKKVDTLTPIITDAEVERYYRSQPKLKNVSLEEIRPRLTLILKKQQLERALEEWIRFLRQKHQATNYLDLSVQPEKR